MGLYNTSRSVANLTGVAFKIWSIDKSMAAWTIAVAGGGDITITDGTTTISIDCSTPAVYTTMGILIDYLNGYEDANGDKLFVVRLIDARREDSTDNALYTLATTGITPGGTPVLFDGTVAASLRLNCAITNIGRNQTDEGRENVLHSITAMNTDGGGSATMYVYACDDSRPDKSSELIATLGLCATATVVQFPAYGDDLNIRVANKRLLVVMDAVAACTGYLSVNGESRPLPCS